jgi:hypothetical protein
MDPARAHGCLKNVSFMTPMSIYRSVKRAPISDVHAEGEAGRTIDSDSAARRRVDRDIEIEYSSRRKAKPATALLRTTSEWLASLPSHIQPMELSRKFPRIVNALCAMWKDSEPYNRYVADLITDRRNGRRGFAVAIVRELELLHGYREAIFPDPDDKWEQSRPHVRQISS